MLQQICCCLAIITLLLSSISVKAGTGMPSELKQRDRWVTAVCKDENVISDPIGPRCSTLPFSFVYNGKSFAQCYRSWKRTVSTAKLDSNRIKHTISYTDPITGLAVECQAIEYRDYPALEWVLHFTNHGSADTPTISNIETLDMTFGCDRSRSVLYRAQGDDNSGNSFRTVEQPLKLDIPEYTMAPAAGRSSEGAFPFFNVDLGGSGVAVAVGWSGQWQSRFSTLSTDTIRVTTGLQCAKLKLHAGESIRTPRVLMVFWSGKDEMRGPNLTRQVLMSHYLPRRNGELVMAPICGSTAVVDPGGNYEAPHIRAAEVLAKRGFEVFWSDCDPEQWYPGGFPNGTGNWYVDKAKYPNGLEPVADAIRKDGLDYLLWFEPERVFQDTMLEKEHPNYIIALPNTPHRLFHLDNPEARRWMTDLLDGYIKSLHLKWLRWDFNIQPLDYWKSCDSEDRQGMTEIRYIEGLYAMWDELQQRNPGLVIDNCASGGRRIDLETMSRGLPLWHSDRQCFGIDDMADQLQTVSLNRWIPMHGCGIFGFEPSYTFRCSMTAGNIVCTDNHAASAPGRDDEVLRTVAIYKKLRPYMLGDFYPLYSFTSSEADFYGYQFDRADQHRGYALILRRKECKQNTTTIALHGIDPTGTYRISFEDTKDTMKLTGKQLMQLEVTIAEAPGSSILYYTRIR